MTESNIRGRFAPTPSGRIHLGNIFCSLLAWLQAKSANGRIVLRIEDLDSVRCPRRNADLLAHDLEWLGLYWDEGAYCGTDSDEFFQSRRSAIYEKYFHKLEQLQLVYPCFCSRAELHAAEAPHLSDGRVIYGGTCRNLTAQQRQEKLQQRAPACRIRVPDSSISFCDGHYGTCSYNLLHDSGDFIIRRSDGIYAYQLAVTVDDALMGINQVVRGCDLLSSTPVQLYLYQLLELKPPAFFHIPLLTAPDGRRLAKRDKDLDLDSLRKEYDSPEPIIGYLAFLAGQLDKPEPLAAADLIKIFDAEKIPHTDIAVPAQLPKL